MASNNISKYYKVDGGLDLTSDSQFATLSANEKIVYKPSGEKYIKNSNYSNVFDKTDTFGELEGKAVAKITDADDNGVASYYSVAGNKIGEFKCGLPIIGSDGKTDVTAVSQNGNILTVEVPRVYYDKYGRVTKWDKQTATAIVSGGSSSGVGYTGVPVGTISMWAGSVSDIPAGWHLCDGTAGTPNLRNRFVVGAGASYNPGNTGYVSQSMGHRVWNVGITNDNGMGRCTLYSHEDKSTGHLTYYGTLVVNGGARSTRFNFPIPFNGEIRVPVMNAVIGRGSDGVAISRPYVLVDEVEPGYIVFTNPDSDGQWRVWFVIEGSTNPDYLVSNNYGVEYYALCYIMKTQPDGSPTVVTNNNPELLWGQTLTVGSVDGKALTVRMPENPNTTYSAGTGLTLSGTTFSISQELLDKINNAGSGGSTDYFDYAMGTSPGASMAYKTYKITGARWNDSHSVPLSTEDMYNVADVASWSDDAGNYGKLGGLGGEWSDFGIYPYKNNITGTNGTLYTPIAHIFYWYADHVSTGGTTTGGFFETALLFTVFFANTTYISDMTLSEVTSRANAWLQNWIDNVMPTLPTGVDGYHGYKVVKGRN